MTGRQEGLCKQVQKKSFDLKESVVEQVLHLPPSWSCLPFLKRFLFELESQNGWMDGCDKDLETPMVHEEVVKNKELVSSDIHLVSLDTMLQFFVKICNTFP